MKSWRFVGSMLAVFLWGFVFLCPANADILFNTVPGPYAAYSPSTGVIGIEDYQADLSGTPFGNNSQTEFLLQSVRFVGGVSVANSTMRFTFLKSDQATTALQFNVTLPSAGNFIWNINLGGNFLVDRVGFLRLEVLNGATGQWFLTQTAPSVGTSPLNPYSNPSGYNFSFELNGISAVPEPSAIGFLAFLSVAASSTLRRRFLC